MISSTDQTWFETPAVIAGGTLKTTLIKGLRQERAYRRKRHKGDHDEKRGKIADMLSIEERPKEVEDRSVPGHWDGDLVMGKYKRSVIGTLVERTTRYVILVSLKATDAISVRKTYTRALQKLSKEIATTLTYDQGKEMSEHKQCTIDTGIQSISPILDLRGSAERTRIRTGLFVSISPKRRNLTRFPCVK